MSHSVRFLAAAAIALLTLPSPSVAETVKIGAAFSLTGNAAAYGAQQKAGVQAAIEDVNKSGKLKGITLELVLEDDATSKEQGIAVFQRFINRDKVSAIIGPTLSTTATAADPLAQQARTPVVAVSNTAPKGITDIGDYIWRVSLTEAQVIPSALKVAQAKIGFKNAAILYGNDDAFTKGGFDVMKASLEAAGIPIVDIQTFATKDRDFNAQLTALKAKNPDFLMVSALVEQAAAIVSQARQLGWNVPIMGGNGFNSPKLMANAGPAAEGVHGGHGLEQGLHRPGQRRLHRRPEGPRQRPRPVLRPGLHRRAGHRRRHRPGRHEGRPRRRQGRLRQGEGPAHPARQVLLPRPAATAATPPPCRS